MVNRNLYLKAKIAAPFLVLFMLLQSNACFSQTIDLGGKWQVRLASGKDKVMPAVLPGTLDDAGIGIAFTDTPKLTIASLGHLTRKTSYIGKAWYARSIAVPAGWKNKQIVLTLGRVIWRTEVSIDNIPVTGTGESLVTAHSFDLSGKLIPGKTHTITIMVDNSNLYPGINIYAKKYADPESYEMVHAYTNHTQVKWNGILGHVSLTARPLISIQDVKVQTFLADKLVKVRYHLNGKLPSKGGIKSYIINPATKQRWQATLSRDVTSMELQGQLAFDKNVIFWDEFHPQQYQLVTILQTEAGNDTSRVMFGIREIGAVNRNLSLNGHRIFIRGNLECVIFPLTGYPPTDKKTWKELYTKAKSFGLNSFRFHSWCPPEAAFEAADEVGFYMQVELPHWNLKVGEDTASFAFLKREAHRILNDYGNHPSFLFFAMGNELEGNFTLLNDLVHELKQEDSRRLYATTSFTFQKDITGKPQPEDDFFVTQWTKDGWVRGQGVFNDKVPDFSKDFSSASAKIPVPLITHEIGQYSVYPDISEIASYTGNLLPNNFIAIRNDLKRKGLVNFAPAFLQASGKLAALLYKEEIERALKTKEIDGFQLLQLQDFPGQGTALVGVLNAFWKPKGFVTAAQFRQFNSPLTPLIRFPKAIYTNQENFEAKVELANFLNPLSKASVYWKVSNNTGKVIRKGIFQKADYPIGNGLEAGTINIPLHDVNTASKLTVEVGIQGTTYKNEWHIWVFPANTRISNHSGIIITDSFAIAKQALSQGKTVLLSPRTSKMNGIEGRFVPVFWSPVHFPDQPGTMGQLIKQKHPSLQQFPTDEHTDWQWWDLVKKSKTMKVDGLADDAVIIRVIDNFVTNGNLANLIEVKVGAGKLILSGIDILSGLETRPAAKQLQFSLISYMQTKAFNPKVSVSMDWIQKFINE